ncbi:MAG: Zn-ribbon domain-containing OB-fold protein [Deltaproteobacteria bacterium]|nr:Zn-ribbon domain-containing OB-fold protein [Deltaproteobacteria bacterium]
MSSGKAVQPFHYAVGLYGSKFFHELKEHRRIVGVKCGKCGKVYVPPRRVCNACFEENKEWVEVGPQGEIGSFTIVRYAFIDPETGVQRPVPYGYGFIRFDGADTLFQHFVELSDERPLKIGARVEPVFADEMKATIRDIRYFRML